MIFFLQSLWKVLWIRVGLTVLCMLLAVALWLGWELSRSLDSLMGERHALETCKNYIGSIDQFRNARIVVYDIAPEKEESISVVRHALGFASIPEDLLEDIKYGKPNAIPSSPLYREDTVIVLRSIDLLQFARFMQHLEQAKELGVCNSFQLNAKTPGDLDDTERWDVQLTLTRLTRSDKRPSVRR